MPKRNQQLECFYGDFSNEQADELISRLKDRCVKHNVSDPMILACVLTELANEMKAETGDELFYLHVVKTFVTQNIRLYKEFINYVNTTTGVKYNQNMNRIVVDVEYWQVNCKENAMQRLFRKCGFPNYVAWSLIVEGHRPGKVLFDDVGSSSQMSIVIKEKPFDANAVDDWDRRLHMARTQPIHPSRLSTL